jgi:arylsulfatase A-like enzyme
VLFVVLDETGFGNFGCFGSPIETATFDALAADGLRFNNMHTTALCSPSRACIVSGNHHANGMAATTRATTAVAARLSKPLRRPLSLGRDDRRMASHDQVGGRVLRGPAREAAR